MRRHRASVVDALRRRLEVRLLGVVDVDELLRVAVVQGEPATLDLDHDLVSGPEGVRDVLEPEVDRRRLAGYERLRLRQAVAELPAHHLAADELLIAPELHRLRARL